MRSGLRSNTFGSLSTQQTKIVIVDDDDDIRGLLSGFLMEEVAATRWVDVSHLDALLENERDTLCPWFSIYIGRWDELNMPV